MQDSRLAGATPSATSTRLITQRSQVQILPPLQVKVQVSNAASSSTRTRVREDSAPRLPCRVLWSGSIVVGFVVADATWLAQLGAHGLVRGSFVPPAPIRRLRDLTRTRTAITRERGREAQRLEKLLEDAGIKLSVVASDILGVSGRAMLEALIAGQRDPGVLADLAKRRLRPKIPELTQALQGRFEEHHAVMARVHLDLIDQHTAAIEALTARIEQVIEPFRGFRDLVCTVPRQADGRFSGSGKLGIFGSA